MSNEQVAVLLEMQKETRKDIREGLRDVNTKLDTLMAGDAPPCRDMKARVAVLEQDRGSTFKFGKFEVKGRYAAAVAIVALLVGAMVWRDISHSADREKIDENIRTIKQMVGGVAAVED